jgi:fatty acid desaturase/nitrite reductase/ring-hydroxylating ferredoxin subunit
MPTATRDYSLTGPESARAVDRGLANANWFQPVIDPTVMRGLQQRTNACAAGDVVLWLSLLIGFGVLAWWSMWSWWSIPAFAAYGALYGGSADPRWHECGHGTAFKSSRANEIIYVFASFMLLRGATVWRWSHYRHHTDTIIVGRDAEIVFQRPPNVWRAALLYTHIQGGSLMFWRLVKHAFGRIDDDARSFVPENELGKVKWESRIYVGIIVATAAASLATGSIAPLMFVGLPSIYGAWLLVFFGVTQHAGMREDVLDHRLNTRTVYMNPVFRFLYLNMNYHVEHHIFPSVPYYALPALHTEIKDQLAPPLPSTWAAYREIWSALWKQQHDIGFELTKPLPPAQAPSRPIDVGERNWVHGPDGSVDLGAVGSFVPGEIRRIDVREQTFVLCAIDAQQVALLDGICTHAQVQLCDGALVDGTIECPKHNGRFDLQTGAPVRKPVRVPLATYDVSVVNGRLVSTLTARTLASTESE